MGGTPHSWIVATGGRCEIRSGSKPFMAWCAPTAQAISSVGWWGGRTEQLLVELQFVEHATSILAPLEHDEREVVELVGVATMRQTGLINRVANLFRAQVPVVAQQ